MHHSKFHYISFSRNFYYRYRFERINVDFRDLNSKLLHLVLKLKEKFIKIFVNYPIQMKKTFHIMHCMVALYLSNLNATSSQGAFCITRIQYDGGGDWYSDPSSIPNMLHYLSDNTNISVNLNEKRTKIGEDIFLENSYFYITGHGNIKLSDNEAQILRDHLIAGAFLHADDNYGMDKSFRREMKKVFPEKDWIEIPPQHPIFNIFYTFPNGLPKIHEHNNAPPQALGLFHENSLIVLYTFESDLGDGWEDIKVHNNPEETRKIAFEMGANIILYALSR